VGTAALTYVWKTSDAAKLAKTIFSKFNSLYKRFLCWI